MVGERADRPRPLLRERDRGRAGAPLVVRIDVAAAGRQQPDRPDPPDDPVLTASAMNVPATTAAAPRKTGRRDL